MCISMEHSLLSLNETHSRAFRITVLNPSADLGALQPWRYPDKWGGSLLGHLLEARLPQGRFPPPLFDMNYRYCHFIYEAISDTHG